MTAKLKKSRHSGESRNPVPLSPTPRAAEGRGEGAASEPLVVREGPVASYLAKSQKPRHSRESGNPVTLQSVTVVGGIFIDGDWVESKDQDPDGNVRLIQLADVGVAEYRDRSSRFLTSQKAKELGCTYLRPGDVLVARMPEPLGRACIFPGDAKPAVTVVDVCIVRPKPDIADPRWLVHRINAPDFRETVASFERGSTRKRISRKNLALIEFELPPLAEQHRIVAELETQLTRLDASVTALKRVQANLTRYRASVLRAACEGHLVPTEADLARSEGRSFESGAELLARLLRERRRGWIGRGQYKEQLAPENTDDVSLPEGWAHASLSGLTALIADVDHKMPKPAISDVPYVSTKDFFGQNEIDFERAKRISRADFEALSRKVRPSVGDILLSRYGTVGEVRHVKATIHFQVSYSIAILKTLAQPALNSFLSYALRAEPLQKQIRRDVRASAQPDLGLEFIRKFVVALPPLAEQQRIVAEVERRLSVIEELEASVAANLKRAERLRQSVLSRSFAGNNA